MFGIAWSEIAVILVIALIVMDPKDIPAAIRSVRGIIRKFHELKREIMGVIHEIDRETGLSELHKDLTQEATKVNQQIRTIVDMNGEMQPTYRLDDIRPDIKMEEEAPSPPKPAEPHHE